MTSVDTTSISVAWVPEQNTLFYYLRSTEGHTNSVSALGTGEATDLTPGAEITVTLVHSGTDLSSVTTNTGTFPAVVVVETEQLETGD